MMILAPEDVDAIRRLAEKHPSLRALQRLLGIDRRKLVKILSGESNSVYAPREGLKTGRQVFGVRCPTCRAKIYSLPCSLCAPGD